MSRFDFTNQKEIISYPSSNQFKWKSINLVSGNVIISICWLNYFPFKPWLNQIKQRINLDVKNQPGTNKKYYRWIIRFKMPKKITKIRYLVGRHKPNSFLFMVQRYCRSWHSFFALLFFDFFFEWGVKGFANINTHYGFEFTRTLFLLQRTTKK